MALGEAGLVWPCLDFQYNPPFSLVTTSGRGGQLRMGWRKLTVRDVTTDLARCGAAQRPISCEARPALRIVLMRQHHP